MALWLHIREFKSWSIIACLSSRVYDLKRFFMWEGAQKPESGSSLGSVQSVLLLKCGPVAPGFQGFGGFVSGVFPSGDSVGLCCFPHLETNCFLLLFSRRARRPSQPDDGGEAREKQLSLCFLCCPILQDPRMGPWS